MATRLCRPFFAGAVMDGDGIYVCSFSTFKKGLVLLSLNKDLSFSAKERKYKMIAWVIE